MTQAATRIATCARYVLFGGQPFPTSHRGVKEVARVRPRQVTTAISHGGLSDFGSVRRAEPHRGQLPRGTRSRTMQPHPILPMTR